MRQISITELCYRPFDLEISEIFPEKWEGRREFSLYNHKARPCSALFFVCTDFEVIFHPEDAPAVRASKGDVLFIPEGSRYRVEVLGDPQHRVETYTVNLRLFDKDGEALLLAPEIARIASMEDVGIESRLRHMSDAFHRAERLSDKELRNYARLKGECFLLLDSLAHAVSESRDSYYPIRQGIEAFCNDWGRNERIETYAAMSGVSVTYFFRCFRKWAGSTPIEYRNTLRLSNAENLLRCTDMRIGEIAQSVGFDDAFYFCRLFTRRFGMSPQSYRKQFRESAT